MRLYKNNCCRLYILSANYCPFKFSSVEKVVQLGHVFSENVRWNFIFQNLFCCCLVKDKMLPRNKFHFVCHIIEVCPGYFGNESCIFVFFGIFCVQSRNICQVYEFSSQYICNFCGCCIRRFIRFVLQRTTEDYISCFKIVFYCFHCMGNSHFLIISKEITHKSGIHSCCRNSRKTLEI